MPSDPNTTQPTDESGNEPEETTQSGVPAGDEFQITVKKLEIPVRPRGVLAE